MLIEAFEETGITLSAKFDSKIITLGDTAAFFKFLDESIQISLHQSRIGVNAGITEFPELISNVSVESGSIKTIVQFLKRRDFHVGVASSLTASLIWALATHQWPMGTVATTNVPVPETIYRIPIDAQIMVMVNVMNQTGKPWSIDIEAKDPRYARDLKVTVKGNQVSAQSGR